MDVGRFVPVEETYHFKMYTRNTVNWSAESEYYSIPIEKSRYIRS